MSGSGSALVTATSFVNKPAANGGTIELKRISIPEADSEQVNLNLMNVAPIPVGYAIPASFYSAPFYSAPFYSAPFYSGPLPKPAVTSFLKYKFYFPTPPASGEAPMETPPRVGYPIPTPSPTENTTPEFTPAAPLPRATTPILDYEFYVPTVPVTEPAPMGTAARETSPHTADM